LSTPNFILFPTTNPITPDAAAGQRMFTLTTNDYTPTINELIYSIDLNMTDTSDQSIVVNCVNSTDPSGDLVTCLNGQLRAGTGVPTGPVGANPFLRATDNRTKTLEITYDVLPAETDSTNTTFLRGYLDSWPPVNADFMAGGIASQTPPSGVLELSDTAGVTLNKMGVQVMHKPSDQPGNRSWRVLEPTEPPGPFAEQVIDGYIELAAPQHNNPGYVRFVDRPERSREGTM